MTDAFWQAVGAVLVAAVTGLFTLLVKQKDPAPAVIPVSPEREHVERATGESTDGVSEPLVRMLAKALSDIEEIRALAADEHEYGDELSHHIDDMIRGHAQGEYPPWPAKPIRRHAHH